MRLSSLSILIQAYNNQDTVRTAIKEAALVGQKYAKDFEIIVTDDGSRDATVAEIRNPKSEIRNLKLVKHKINQGFGKTIKEQYCQAAKDFVFTLPADRQIRATILPKLMEKIGKYEMVIGRRLKRRDSWPRQFQSRLYHFLLKLLFGLPLYDVNSSKLFRRKILQNIKLDSNSAFVDAQLCLGVLKKGYKIGGVAIAHYASQKGSGGGGSLRTILPVIADMFLSMIKFRPK